MMLRSTLPKELNGERVLVDDEDGDDDEGIESVDGIVGMFVVVADVVKPVVAADERAVEVVVVAVVAVAVAVVVNEDVVSLFVDGLGISYLIN